MGRCERFLCYDRETGRHLCKGKRVAVGVRFVRSCDGRLQGYAGRALGWRPFHRPADARSHGSQDALWSGGLPTDLPPLVGTGVRTSEGLIDSAAYAAAKLMGERVVAAK